MRLLKLILALLIILLLVKVISVYGKTRDTPSVELSWNVLTWDFQSNYRLLLVDKVNSALGSYTLAEAVVDWCMNHSDNYYTCMRHVFGVANAESWLFRDLSSANNWFGIMEKCWNTYCVKRFSSAEEWVIYFIKLYEKNKRYKRTKGSDWIGTYCTSACTNWTQAFNEWMAKLDLSLI